MASLPDILRGIAQKIIPTRTKIVRIDTRHDPESATNYIDVDSLHGAIEEARSGDTRRLFALYRDILLGTAHIQAEFNTRKLAIVGERPNLQAISKDAGVPQDIRDQVATMWRDCRGTREAITHLLDACLWPVALVEKTYRPTTTGPLRYALAGLKPVPYHLLDYTQGRMRIRDVDCHGQPLQTFHEPDQSRYIIHRGHLLTSIPDNFGGPMRAALFWWLFATQDRDWWIRFLERFGSPFIVGKYDTANPGDRSLLTMAFSAATRIFGLVVSRDTDIELHAAATTSHGEAFSAFHAVANRELSKLILGQTMTSEAQSSGLGSSQAQVHNEVRGDIRQFDSLALGQTLREQLFVQLCQINGLDASLAPEITWGTDATDASTMSQALTAATSAGLRPSDSALPVISSRLGFEVERSTTGNMPASLAAFASPGWAETIAAQTALELRESLQTPRIRPQNTALVEDLLASAGLAALRRQ